MAKGVETEARSAYGILIVDDERSLRFTIGEALRGEGFRVFEAPGGIVHVIHERGLSADRLGTAIDSPHCIARCMHVHHHGTIHEHFVPRHFAVCIALVNVFDKPRRAPVELPRHRIAMQHNRARRYQKTVIVVTERHGILPVDRFADDAEEVIVVVMHVRGNTHTRPRLIRQEAAVVAGSGGVAVERLTARLRKRGEHHSDRGGDA